MPIEQSLPLLSSLIIPKSCLTRRADLSGFWSFTLSPANSCLQTQSSPSATALASPKAPTVGALALQIPGQALGNGAVDNTQRLAHDFGLEDYCKTLLLPETDSSSYIPILQKLVLTFDDTKSSLEDYTSKKVTNRK